MLNDSYCAFLTFHAIGCSCAYHNIIVGILKRGEYSTLIFSAVMVGCLLYSTRGTLSDPDGCLESKLLVNILPKRT